MTSIFLQLRKSQNVLNFCSHLFENQLRYIYIYIYIYICISSSFQIWKLVRFDFTRQERIKRSKSTCGTTFLP